MTKIKCPDLTTIKSEARIITHLAWPLSLSVLLQSITSCISVIFCGHLGKEILDAVSLASMFINVFGMAILLGLSWACDTLFAQSFGGTNKANMGLVLQRGIVVEMLACLPITAIFINAEHILALTGQSQYVYRMAGVYIWISISALPAIAMWTVFRSFVFSQGIVHVHYILFIVSNIANVGFHLLLVTYLDLQIIGSAIAFSLTHWMNVGLYLCYIIYKRAYAGLWTGLTWECLDRLYDFLSLAIPGMLMVFVEWSAGDVITFVAGLLGETDLAAYTIVYNLWLLVGSLPLGLQFGSSNRVGFHLGANNPEMARCAFWATMLILIPFSVMLSLGLLCLHQVIPYVFTSDQEVAELASHLIKWLALMMFTADIELVLKGVLRGVGELAIGSVVNCIAYPVIAIPIGVPLMLKTDLRVAGGILGMFAGTLFQCIVYQLVLMRVNWKNQALRAQERAKIAPEEHLQDSEGQLDKTSPSEKDTFTEMMTSNVDPLEMTINVTKSKTYGTIDKRIHGKDELFDIYDCIEKLERIRYSQNTTEMLKTNNEDQNVSVNNEGNNIESIKTTDDTGDKTKHADSDNNTAKAIQNNRNKTNKEEVKETKNSNSVSSKDELDCSDKGISRQTMLKLKFIAIFSCLFVILVVAVCVNQYLTSLRENVVSTQSRTQTTKFEIL